MNKYNLPEATAIEEFFEITKNKYEHTKYHHLPLVFANLLRPNHNSLIIAKGKTRKDIMARMANFRLMISNEVGHISYEPNLNILKSYKNNSLIRFATTGACGGLHRINTMKKLDTILLYEFKVGKKEWEELYKQSATRAMIHNTNILVHYS